MKIVVASLLALVILTGAAPVLADGPRDGGRSTPVQAEDPEFTAVFSYYGGALMRAIAEFSDGYRCDLFIYAPILPAEAVAPGPGAAPDGKTAHNQ